MASSVGTLPRNMHQAIRPAVYGTPPGTRMELFESVAPATGMEGTKLSFRKDHHRVHAIVFFPYFAARRLRRDHADLRKREDPAPIRASRGLYARTVSRRQTARHPGSALSSRHSHARSDDPARRAGAA